MTVKEVLKDVMDTLNNISIQGGLDFATMVDTVGMPIARAINGIKICVDAMEKAEAEEAAKEEEGVQELPKKEESMLEILPEEESKE